MGEAVVGISLFICVAQVDVIIFKQNNIARA